MSRETQNVQVGNEVYQVTPFVATKGLAYLKKLLKVVGPALAEIAGEGDGTVNADGLGKAAAILFDNLDKEGLDLMIKEWVDKYVTKNGQPVIFDTEFMADYGILFGLVKEIIVINYSSVFQDGFGGILSAQANLLKP